MKIICIGRNYAEHAKEMKSELPTKPIFFMKPDTALLQKSDIFFYPDFTSNLHFECELVVKINRVGKSIAEKYAHKYYNEIGLGIDFTARDLQAICKEKSQPWEIAKSFDNSAALSEEFIQMDQLPKDGIQFTFEQNGKIVQTGNSKDMLFTIDQIISFVSIFITLKTGDLIYTGTPAGVGPVAIGDQLIGKIGDKKMFEFQVK